METFPDKDRADNIITDDTSADMEVTLLELMPSEDNRLRRRSIRQYRGEQVDVNLRASLRPEENGRNVALEVTVTYVARRFPFPEMLLRYGATGRFAVDAPEGTMDSEGDVFRLPHHLLTLMLGTVVGALRGMVALETAGTALSNSPLPLLNVARLAESITTRTNVTVA